MCTKVQTNRKKRIAAALCGAVAAVLLTVLCISGGGNPVIGLKLIFGKGALTVGGAVDMQSITQFYHTVSTSTNPAYYQRYHFYEENGAYFFFHETREGSRWPLTEEDATEKGTIELSDVQWAQLLEALDGGSVRKRGSMSDSGSRGPWMYLYWKDDKGKIQEFTFASQEKATAFEEFCLQLKGEGA